MACYAPINLPELMRARRMGKMKDAPPRDDIGVVVRDQGPGTWRGVMVSGGGVRGMAQL